MVTGLEEVVVSEKHSTDGAIEWRTGRFNGVSHAEAQRPHGRAKQQQQAALQ